jgi:hypothetical protein
MNWNAVVSGVIAVLTGLLSWVIQKIYMKKDSTAPILDPKWAEIVAILPRTELNWLFYQLDLGLQQPHGHGGSVEHMAFFKLVAQRIVEFAAQDTEKLAQLEQQNESKRLDALYSKPPESGDYVTESTIAGPTRYYPTVEQFEQVDNGIGWVDPNRRFQEWASYTERDAEYGKTLNEKRSA